MKKFFLAFTLILFSIIAKAQKTEDYIAENAELAQKLMREHKVPASLILGIAIHESAAGKSKIARYLNNHFGVKGPNSNAEIRSTYRDYPSVDSSYNHFVSFLHKPTYSALFEKYDQYDYKNWTLGIKRAGYAHSRTWAKQVINIIQKYELYQYDERPDDYIEVQLAVAKINPKKRRLTKSKFYTVKKGENLSVIANRNKTTSSALMQKNNLESAALQPGQKLKI
jgi:hypothetical protein